MNLRSFLIVVFAAPLSMIWSSPVVASPCASIAARMPSEPMRVGKPVIVLLSLTSQMPSTVVIYEEVAAWDYNWEVKDAMGAPLKLTKLGEHYSDKAPHISVGRVPTNLATGASVNTHIDLSELVVFPGAGDYQLTLSRTIELPNRKSCSASMEPLHFKLEPGQ